MEPMLKPWDGVFMVTQNKIEIEKSLEKKNWRKIGKKILAYQNRKPKGHEDIKAYFYFFFFHKNNWKHKCKKLILFYKVFSEVRQPIIQIRTGSTTKSNCQQYI